MNPQLINKKDLIKFSLLSLTIILIIILIQANNNHTKIIFCDVGQGDAVYLRIKNNVDVLIDAGPNKSVLSCLGKYMPFWDKKIEIAFLTHHDKDHYSGYFEIIKRYKIDNFLTIKFPFDKQTYKKLEKEILKQKINYRYLYTNDIIKIINNKFILLWPNKNIKSYDSNDYSLVFLYEENNYKILFTGDASLTALTKALTYLNPKKIKINILKIPHHGSKNNINEKILQLIKPEIAVISSGKNNSYGHPNKKVLDMLKTKNIKIRRTDKEGNIIFKLIN